MIGFGLLVLAVLNLLDVQKHTYKLAELNTINLRSIIIFLGTGAFGVLFLSSAYFFRSGCLANRRSAGLHIIYCSQLFRYFFLQLFCGRMVGSGLGRGLYKKV